MGKLSQNISFSKFCSYKHLIVNLTMPPEIRRNIVPFNLLVRYGHCLIVQWNYKGDFYLLFLWIDSLVASFLFLAGIQLGVLKCFNISTRFYTKTIWSCKCLKVNEYQRSETGFYEKMHNPMITWFRIVSVDLSFNCCIVYWHTIMYANHIIITLSNIFVSLKRCL